MLYCCANAIAKCSELFLFEPFSPAINPHRVTFRRSWRPYTFSPLTALCCSLFFEMSRHLHRVGGPARRKKKLLSFISNFKFELLFVCLPALSQLVLTTRPFSTNRSSLLVQPLLAMLPSGFVPGVISQERPLGYIHPPQPLAPLWVHPFGEEKSPN